MITRILSPFQYVPGISRAAVGAAALAGALAFAPAPAQAQTLAEALIAAYSNNPTLAARRARLRATDEQVPQALSNWRPSVAITGDAGYERNRSTLRTTDRTQNRNPATVGLSITQPLYRGGRTLAATEGAENAVRAERARLIDTEQDILLSAATAYLNVFRDEAVLSLNINNEKVLKRQLEATKDRFEVGEITRTDVHQAEARLAGATADRIRAEANLENSRATYENVVGLPAPKNLELPGEPGGLPKDRHDAIKMAATTNPNVIAAEFDRKAGMNTVREVKGELLPEVDVTASADRSYESSGETGRIDSAEVRVNLTIPIYQQGSVYSRLREAKQSLAELTRNIDQARRDAIEDATSAWENLQTARARVVSFSAQIEANVVALDGVEREAAVGSRTVLDVLDAEQELLDSRVGHTEAQRDERIAAFELSAAIGRMTATDLKLAVDVYDPRMHYDEVRGKWVGGSSSEEGK
ncbi:MAG: TolC family outer membrane protein [Alphaproteobacteria bacterium]